MATPPIPSGDPAQKINVTPVYLSVINELNLNSDQVNKRAALIRRIEESLSTRYGSPNRLITYMLRFGHARTIMHTSDIPSLEAILNSLSGAEQINVLLHSPGGDGSTEVL
jgi:hypothetical protein